MWLWTEYAVVDERLDSRAFGLCLLSSVWGKKEKKKQNSKFGRLDLARDCSDWTLEPLKLWAEYAVVDERLDSGASSCCN